MPIIARTTATTANDVTRPASSRGLASTFATSCSISPTCATVPVIRLYECLIHDDDARAVHAILAVECASFDDRNPHGREVAAADERTFCEERSRRIAASLFAEPEAGAAV